MTAALPLTPSQTVGPFFLDCLLRPDARCNVLAPQAPAGTRLRIEGAVLDGDGVGVPDAVVEIWQADASGRYRRANDGDAPDAFVGFGRSSTDAAGEFWFETVKPGPVPFDGTRLQAPHVNVAVFARGLLNHLFTRLYFPEDDAPSSDPILEHVDPARRSTLIARRTPNASTYRLDIVLQGAAETVFFDFVAPRTA